MSEENGEEEEGDENVHRWMEDSSESDDTESSEDDSDSD